VLVLVAVVNGLGRLAGSLGSEVADAVPSLPAASGPSATLVPLLDAPVLATAQPYTNRPNVDLSGSLPTDVTGASTYRLRVYQSLGTASGQRSLVREQPLGLTPEFTVSGVVLQPGLNFFSATLIGPGGETKPSAAVRVVYYATPPTIVMTAPLNGQTVSGTTVTLAGRTRAGSVVIARDAATGGSATGTAGADDTFAITLALASGVNGMTLHATDPAGNSSDLALSIVGGTGRLTLTLSASAVQFSAASLPQSLTLTASVSGPKGQPLGNATVAFAVTVPGVNQITQAVTTDSAGTAAFATSIPHGATPGAGVATAAVTTAAFGTASARMSFVVQH
jgi:hypothetical protein